MFMTSTLEEYEYIKNSGFFEAMFPWAEGEYETDIEKAKEIYFDRYWKPKDDFKNIKVGDCLEITEQGREVFGLQRGNTASGGVVEFVKDDYYKVSTPHGDQWGVKADFEQGLVRKVQGDEN